MKDHADERRNWQDPETGQCPVADTLQILSGKHGPKVLHVLMGGELHYLEMHRAIGDVSKKVLSEQLSNFETHGLITRTEKEDARRRVGYALTNKGRALTDILSQISEWSWVYNGQSRAVVSHK